MKYSGIANFIKKRKSVRVAEFDDVQWIGDGAVFYPIFGMRALNDEELIHFLDLDPSDITVDHLLNPPIDFTAETMGEIFINDRGSNVVIGGEMCRTYYTEQGALFFAEKYFKPVESDKSVDVSTDVYMRVSERNGKQFPYIVLKKGIYIFAVICPIDTWSNDTALKNFRKLAEQVKLARLNFAFFDQFNEECSGDEDDDKE